MATDSADGTDVSVPLPSDLEEWLDERAAALDVERGELLVQLASAYRATATYGDDSLADPVDDDETVGDIESRLAAEDEALADRVDDVEAELAANVEDLRNRVLQLRNAVGESASENHSHREFSKLGTRVDDLSAELDAVAGDLEDRSERISEVASGLDDAEEKLTRVARSVVAIRREEDRDAAESSTLDRIRRAANRSGVADSACGNCDESVTIGLLTEAACPHCETAFTDLELPTPGLGRTLGLRRPQLRCSDPPALEDDDE